MYNKPTVPQYACMARCEADESEEDEEDEEDEDDEEEEEEMHCDECYDAG